MRKVLVFAAIVCLSAMWAFAQESGGQTSTSSGTQSTPKSTRKHRATKNTTDAASNEAANPKNSQLTGCLSGPNDEGAYVLKNGRYTKGVEVGGRDDLKDHVGHKVKLTGTWSTGAAIGEKHEAGEKGENEGKKERGHRHFKVDTVTHVADSCTVGAGGKTSSKGASGSGPANQDTPIRQ